jgi:hypothetical protein
MAGLQFEQNKSMILKYDQLFPKMVEEIISSESGNTPIEQK